METSRGYNPVGQSAPGLPCHDAPLPGHVPGQYNPIGGDSFGSMSGGQAGGGDYVHRPADPGLGDWFGKWSARVFMAFATYLSIPPDWAVLR